MDRLNAIVGVVLVASAFGCDALGGSRGGPPDYCESLTQTTGIINTAITSKVVLHQNWIQTPWFRYWGSLPPGLSFDQSTGVISGTPTQAGTWKIRFGVQDRQRGTHDHLNDTNTWYFQNFYTDFIIYGSEAEREAQGGAQVWFMNDTKFSCDIYLDGRNILTLPSGEWQTKGIGAAGRHWVRAVRGDGREIASVDVNFSAGLHHGYIRDTEIEILK
jgi:hypothetical protein